MSQSHPNMILAKKMPMIITYPVKKVKVILPNRGSRAIVFTCCLHRRIFACPGEEQSIIEVISFVQKGKSNDGQVVKRLYTGKDQFALCTRCDLNIMNSSLREVKVLDTLLHTIHHGTISIRVIGLIFLKCGMYIPYDELFDGVFRLNQYHLFFRELLDAWICDVCGTGGTFRDPYSSCASKSFAKTASFHKTGWENYANRPLSNDAFRSFLKVLTFTSEKDLHELFSCPDCEKEDVQGNR